MDTIITRGFYDLCVNASNDDLEELRQVLAKLYKLGYRTVALNNTVEETAIGSDKKKKKKKNEPGENVQNIVPDPPNLESLKVEFKNKLQILTRLTFVCADPGKTHALGHCSSLKKYNLYAIVPKTQNALQFACSQLNVDIITLSPSITGLKLNRKLYQQAVERGLHFEIQYADVLDPQSRKTAIHNSHLFYTYGKSKGVFVSSGASKVATLRNPYDIITLSLILGLSEVKAKAAILQQCRTLILKAERRRRGKGVFIIEKIDPTESAFEDEVSPQKKIKV